MLNLRCTKIDDFPNKKHQRKDLFSDHFSLKFISDNEDLDQPIPYRRVYKGKKVYMNFF